MGPYCIYVQTPLTQEGGLQLDPAELWSCSARLGWNMNIAAPLGCQIFELYSFRIFICRYIFYTHFWIHTVILSSRKSMKSLGKPTNGHVHRWKKVCVTLWLCWEAHDLVSSREQEQLNSANLSWTNKIESVCLFICILAADQRELYGLIIEVLFISTADAVLLMEDRYILKNISSAGCVVFAEDEASI